jgi:hypothetical protein
MLVRQELWSELNEFLDTTVTKFWYQNSATVSELTTIWQECTLDLDALCLLLTTTVKNTLQTTDNLATLEATVNTLTTNLTATLAPMVIRHAKELTALRREMAPKTSLHAAVEEVKTMVMTHFGDVTTTVTQMNDDMSALRALVEAHTTQMSTVAQMQGDLAALWAHVGGQTSTLPGVCDETPVDGRAAPPGLHAANDHDPAGTDAPGGVAALHTTMAPSQTLDRGPPGSGFTFSKQEVRAHWSGSGSRTGGLNARLLPFWNVTSPWNLYAPDARKLPVWNVTPPRNPYAPLHPIRNDSATCVHVRQSQPTLDGQEDRRIYEVFEEELLGGRIESPHHADRRCIARSSKVSPFDIAGLANSRYHGGEHGYDPLTMTIIHSCGYSENNSSDVIVSYNDIIHIRREVREHWDHPWGYSCGPQIDRILEKGLATFLRLTSLDVESAVEFYNNFHKTLLIYLLPVVPFDCISIKMGYEALCPPGLGLRQYGAILRVMMKILPHLIPWTDMQISSLISMVCMELNNGYSLLWRILKLTVSGFDPANLVKIPKWQNNDIFNFAIAIIWYFWLRTKKGVVYDHHTRSTTFLRLIDKPVYIDVIRTLLTCINNYYADEDEGYLPTNLCVMGLASQLHSNAQARAGAVVPRVRWVDGISQTWSVPVQGSPRLLGWTPLVGINHPQEIGGMVIRPQSGCFRADSLHMVDVAVTALTLGVMLVREDMCTRTRTKVIGHRISFAMLVAGRAVWLSAAICWRLLYSLRNTKWRLRRI